MKSDNQAGGRQGVEGARFSAEIYAELFNRAEKELAAFVKAVHALHGEEQARAAADDWLLALIALKEPCKGASLDLRSVTISAATRCARRLYLPWPAHAVLALIAAILLLAGFANAHAAHSNPRYSVTQNKSAKLVVIRGKSVSAKHEFQRDSHHTSKNSHNAVCDVQFTHSCAQRSVQSVGTNSTQESNSMEAIGLLVTLEARRGKEADAEAFLKSAQPLALDEKGTLKWYAIKLGPGRFGIFDTFANEGGRNAHLTGEIAKALGARANELLSAPPQIEKVEVLASTPLKG
jgi:quinol monooxygenase YgiN